MQVYFSIMDKKVGNLFHEGATEHVIVNVKTALNDSDSRYKVHSCRQYR